MTFAPRHLRRLPARSCGSSLRNPAWVIIGLIQPILYLVLFGPLLKPGRRQRARAAAAATRGSSSCPGC